MSHRPLTNTSSLKITAAYCACEVLLLEVPHFFLDNELLVEQGSQERSTDTGRIGQIDSEL